MLKGRYILLCLLDKRKLSSFCSKFGVSYKYVHAIARNENCDPSLKIMRAFLPIIDMSFWAEEADKEFKKLYAEKIDVIIQENGLSDGSDEMSQK
jgi:hypothetical protein